MSCGDMHYIISAHLGERSVQSRSGSISASIAECWSLLDGTLVAVFTPNFWESILTARWVMTSKVSSSIQQLIVPLSLISVITVLAFWNVGYLLTPLPDSVSVVDPFNFIWNYGAPFVRETANSSDIPKSRLLHTFYLRATNFSWSKITIITTFSLVMAEGLRRILVKLMK